MRNILEQYEYETKERGLDHKTALDQMKWMFPKEQLDILDEIYKDGYAKGAERY